MIDEIKQTYWMIQPKNIKDEKMKYQNFMRLVVWVKYHLLKRQMMEDI